MTNNKSKVIMKERREIELKGVGKQRTYLVYLQKENNDNSSENFSFEDKSLKTPSTSTNDTKPPLSELQSFVASFNIAQDNKPKYNIEKRGEIELKGRGKQVTYLINPS